VKQRRIRQSTSVMLCMFFKLHSYLFNDKPIHPKKTILSSFTHPYVIEKWCTVILVEYKRHIFFEESLKVL